MASEPNRQEVEVVGLFASGHVVGGHISRRHAGPHVVVPRPPRGTDGEVAGLDQVLDPLFVPCDSLNEFPPQRAPSSDPKTNRF